MSQILGKVLARWWSEVRKGGDLRIKGTLSQFTIACLLIRILSGPHDWLNMVSPRMAWLEILIL